MQTIPQSDATRKALNELKELNRKGKVFDKDKAVLRDAELEKVIHSVIENVGKDTKRYLNIQHQVEVSGDLLFNLRAIVRTCGLCFCDFTLYDDDAGTCTYLGSLRRPGCIGPV